MFFKERNLTNMFFKILHQDKFLSQNFKFYCRSRYFSTTILRCKRFRIFKKYGTLENKLGIKHPSAFLQAVGSGAYGTPKTLFVESPFYRFLFNCEEGTRRLTNEHSIGDNYFKRVFITSLKWENISGLIGFMYLPEHENPNRLPPIRKIYGPPGLKNIMRSYLPLFSEFDPTENCFEVRSEDLIFEKSLTVKTVPLHPTGLSIRYSKDSFKDILAYICTFPSTPGALSSEKLVDASVPPGPLVDCLKNGLPVTLQDGTVVTPSDVTYHIYGSSTFIVLEIPSPEYLDALTSSSDFEKYKRDKIKDEVKDEIKNDLEENNLEVIVHMSPADVMKDPRYQKWVNSFSPSVSHLVMNNRSSCLGLHSPVKLQLQINQVNSKIFPLHNNPGVPFVSSDISTEEESLDPSLITSGYGFDGLTVQANSALKYVFRPQVRFESSRLHYLNRDQVLNECLEDESVLDSIKELNSKFDALNYKRNLKGPNSYPIISFLGTGASMGSNLRNDSGILIKLSDKTCVLLDCGSQTLTQFLRFKGKTETFATLRRLKLVFVSHRHLDHWSGLTALLEARKTAFIEAGIMTPPPMHIFMPPGLIRVFKDINCSFDKNFQVNQNVYFVNNNRIASDGVSGFTPFSKILSYTELKNISITPVQHCSQSYGVALHHKCGRKIVYSGDSMPSKNLIRIGKNCDLLIHEATFEDGCEEDANQKRHSTVSQAVQVAKNMKAKFTILTHFAARCRRIPLVEDSVLKENVGVAFDCMEVRFDDLQYLPHIYPLLREMFFNDFNDNLINQHRRNFLRDHMKENK